MSDSQSNKSGRQRSLLGMESEPLRVTKAETFAEVLRVFPLILERVGQATADAIRDSLKIPPAGLPAIGRAIAVLYGRGIIEPVGFQPSRRSVAHARPVKVWRLVSGSNR